MIDFPCHCGFKFSVPQDLAGGLIQCPRCKRLNDVPLLSDLQHLEESGIYKIDAPATPLVQENTERVRELTYVYTRDRYDGQGNPIDLRPTPEESLRGPEPIPVEDDPSRGTPKTEVGKIPKYDPVTGELIRPVDIKPSKEPPAHAVPVAKQAPQVPPTIVNGMDVPAPLEALSIPLKLFHPINLFVMSFLLFGHLLGQGMTLFIAAGYLLLAPFWLALQALIIGHFGNVIDETGPQSRPELPTPARNLTYEDTVGPFFQLLGAFVVCYAPALLMLLTTPSGVPTPAVMGLALALAIVGTLFFPAAALTVTTSGTVLNLRPDRMVGVALVCGAEYLLALTTWSAGLIFYLAGIIGVNWIGAASLPDSNIPKPPFLKWYLAYAALAIGIYVLHWFFWHLGTLYRRHHERFPWVFQRHTSDRPRIEQSAGFPVRRSPTQAVRHPAATAAQDRRFGPNSSHP